MRQQPSHDLAKLMAWFPLSDRILFIFVFLDQLEAEKLLEKAARASVF